jgi:hypothetical protein
MKTFQEVINTPPDAYISGGFEAYVTAPRTSQTKSGKTIHKCKLSDGGASVIEATSFAASFAPYEGKKVAFTGMGLKRGADYNGTAQVSIGDRAQIAVAGEGAPAAAPSVQRDGNSTTVLKPKEPVNPALRIADMGSLFVLCYREAGKTAENVGRGEDHESIRAIATTYFIQATKDGLLAGR